MMAIKNIKDTLLWILFIVSIGLLIWQNRSCESSIYKPTYSQGFVDSLNNDNNALVDEICDLHADISVLDSTLLFKKDRVIKGRETIKYLEKTVTITDTVVITYVDALNWQIKELDTIVDIQGKKIDKQAQIIDKQDTVISNTNKIVAIQEEEIEAVQKKIKTLEKKNYLDKIKGGAIAIFGVIGTILIMK